MQNISSTYHIHIKGLLVENLFNFCSRLDMKRSARIGPKGDPIATLSICTNFLSRSLNGTLHTACSNSCLNCELLNGIGGELGF